MTGNPRVLVVMPVYNALPYLPDAIESVLAQTYTDFTLLIVNDGSTDGSRETAASFQDERVIIHDQENQGPGAAMNYAVRYAVEKGIPLLARMDADDLSLPERLRKQVALLERFPQAAACSCNCDWIEAQGGRTIGASTVSTAPGLIRWEIDHGLRGLIQGAALFRTQALAEAGGYRPQFRRAEEVDLFLRLAERHELRNCPETLYKIRIHAASHSVKDVRGNILYQFYALDCAHRRRRGLPEHSYDEFTARMGLGVRYGIWREETLLGFWRGAMHRRSPLDLVLAALVDPRRVAVRLLRKLDRI